MLGTRTIRLTHSITFHIDIDSVLHYTFGLFVIYQKIHFGLFNV